MHSIQGFIIILSYCTSQTVIQGQNVTSQSTTPTTTQPG